jgi:hypothetical protein
MIAGVVRAFPVDVDGMEVGIRFSAARVRCGKVIEGFAAVDAGVTRLVNFAKGTDVFETCSNGSSSSR